MIFSRNLQKKKQKRISKLVANVPTNEPIEFKSSFTFEENWKSTNLVFKNKKTGQEIKIKAFDLQKEDQDYNWLWSVGTADDKKRLKISKSRRA